MSEVAFSTTFLQAIDGPSSGHTTHGCRGFIVDVGQQLTRIGGSGHVKMTQLSEVSNEARGCYYGRGRGDTLLSIGQDSRKFGDEKPMKIRRLDWDSYLFHCIKSSSNAPLIPFSSMS